MPGRAVALSLLVLVCACAVRGAESPGGAVGPASGAGPTRAAGAAAHGQRAAIADGGTFVRPADPPSARRPRPLRRVRPVEQADPEVLAARLLREINAARRRAGAPPLRTDPALTRAAQRYARELASRREIEHVSRTPGRRTFRQRIAAAGGRARVAGENLARLTAHPSTLHERAVRAWMQSPGHRHNMLDPTYRRTGIGIWLGRDGIWYIVQEFASAN